MWNRSREAEGTGLEPVRACARRFSRPLHYHSASPPARTKIAPAQRRRNGGGGGRVAEARTGSLGFPALLASLPGGIFLPTFTGRTTVNGAFSRDAVGRPLIDSSAPVGRSCGRWSRPRSRDRGTPESGPPDEGKSAGPTARVVFREVIDRVAPNRVIVTRQRVTSPHGR